MSLFNKVIDFDNSDGEIDIPKVKKIENLPSEALNYRSLKELAAGFPYQKLINYHTFGVIVNYYPSKQELEIKDETLGKFFIQLYFHNRQKNQTTQHNFELKKQLEEMLTKCGNIIRFHRLQLTNISAICSYVNDIMIFETHNANRVCGRCVSKDPSISKQEISRLKELQDWHINSLLNPEIVTFKSLRYLDFACQVFQILPYGKSGDYLFIGWSGDKLLNYISQTFHLSYSFNEIFVKIYKKNYSNLYIHEFFHELYYSKSLIFIVIRSSWKSIVKTIEPFSTVIFYNLALTQVDNQSDWIYTFYDNSKFPGRILRTAEYGSLIERAIRRRTMKKYEEFEKSKKNSWNNDSDWDNIQLGIGLE